jgi:hypothetical protein
MTSWVEVLTNIAMKQRPLGLDFLQTYLRESSILQESQAIFWETHTGLTRAVTSIVPYPELVQFQITVGRHT